MNKIPKVVKDLIRKYNAYYQCCDICKVSCCKGVTRITIDNVVYAIDKSGPAPTLVVVV